MAKCYTNYLTHILEAVFGFDIALSSQWLPRHTCLMARVFARVLLTVVVLWVFASSLFSRCGLFVFVHRPKTESSDDTTYWFVRCLHLFFLST